MRIVGDASVDGGVARSRSGVVGVSRRGVARIGMRERDGGASVGAVHAVAVGVAVRGALRCCGRRGDVAMDGGASRMGFLLPSFSRRDNLVKYD